jgi:serine/threonine protein kinase/tetratricopeptide (TPR) repeat protein
MNRLADAPTDVLFGLIALHNDLIAPTVIPDAFRALAREGGRTLAEHLVAHGALTGAQRALVESLSCEYMARHGGDLHKSVASLIDAPSARARLDQLGEPELANTIAPADSHPATPLDPERAAAVSHAGERFQILRRHAKGGLGEVFVALDRELNREVALKQLQDRCAADHATQRRFVAEAEITGGLEHPGIVPVYGLGRHDHGRPYYVMRYIRGESLMQAINRFHKPNGAPEPTVGSGEETIPAFEDAPETVCSAPALAGPIPELELRRLLRRFLDVCNTIEYAHSRGVLHRDLKPANIVVGKYGETLVVDWGLAKPLGWVEPGQHGGEGVLVVSSASGSAETLPGSTLGTPAYMSPEQAEGKLDRLGPRSDVYSLGATLYCLLTGGPPFAGKTSEIIDAVRLGRFPPPRHLKANIDRGLEAICLKAMAQRPEHRYDSCRALADDLESWMADEPVTAWREPPARRARRWARHHRSAVTGAIAALVAGMAGLVTVLVVETRANAELTRSQAAVQARYDLAVEAIRTFHTGVSADFLLKQDQFKNVRDRLLKSASDFYGKLGRLLDNESGFGSRRALASANYEVAELTSKVGHPEDALEAHRQVLVARRNLAAQAPDDPDLQGDVARSLTAVASGLEITGRTKDAELTFRQAETLIARHNSSRIMPAQSRAALADCRRRLGSLLRSVGRNDEALAVLRQALADQETLGSGPGSDLPSRRDLAATMIGIADVLAQTGQTESALDEYRQALAIEHKLVDENPGVAEYESALALAHNNLGVVLSNKGQLKEAEAEYQKAIAIQETLADDNPGVIDFRKTLATIHHDLGWLHSNHGEPGAAATEYKQSLAILQKLTDDNPRVAELQSRLALSHNNLAYLLSQTGAPSEALAEYRKTHSILETLVDRNPSLVDDRHRLGMSLLGYGRLLLQMGKTAEAEAQFKKAITLYQKLTEVNNAVPAFRSFLAYSHYNLGIVLTQAGALPEAEVEHRNALLVRQKLIEGDPTIPQYQRDMADSLLSIGWLLALDGKTTDAIGYFTREEAIREKLALAGSATALDKDRLANCQTNTANLLRRNGKLDEALAACERARALREPLVTAQPQLAWLHTGLSETYLRLGQVRFDMRDLDAAAADWKRACAMLEEAAAMGPEETFIRACCHSALAGLASRPGSEISAAEAADRTENAMGLLRRAVALGYRIPGAYRTESALDPLRDLPDFQMLLLDVAFPAEPFVSR